jgi:cobalt-zinc-cadmium efflux system protein
VIVAGVVIVFTSWYPIDPILSLAIAVLIARGAWLILRDTIEILMESTPKGLNLAQMVRDIIREPEVQDVHDLHVWTIAGGMSALSAHVQMEDRPLSDCDPFLGRLNRVLSQRYNIAHATIQLECAGCATTHLYCAMETNDGRQAHGHEQTGDGLDVQDLAKNQQRAGR